MDIQRIRSRIKAPKVSRKIPLVEIAGKNRVLIENHLGVLAYSLENIQIRVTYGKLSVNGSQLMLLEMNREQLVIQGNIASLELYGG